MNQHDREVYEGNAASSPSPGTVAPHACHPTLWSLEYKAGIRVRESERDRGIRQVERSRAVDGAMGAKTKHTDMVELSDIIVCFHLMLERLFTVTKS